MIMEQEPRTHEFCELLGMIEELRKRVAALEVKDPEVGSKRSRPGSLGEVLLHFAKVGLPESDGKWFWSHGECSGWRNNGKVMRSWTHCVTAWKLANVFPSQKVNGHKQGIFELKTILDAKKQEKDELVRKFYNDSSAFPSWTNEPARQRFIILKREIINLNARIGQSA